MPTSYGSARQFIRPIIQQCKRVEKWTSKNQKKIAKLTSPVAVVAPAPVPVTPHHVAAQERAVRVAMAPAAAIKTAQAVKSLRPLAMVLKNAAAVSFFAPPSPALVESGH